MGPIYDPIATNLPGVVLLILLTAAPLAFLVSIGLLSLYRRAVFRAMRTRAPVGRTVAPVPLETSVPSQEPVDTALNIVVLDSASMKGGESATESLYTSLLRAPWRAAAIYTIAGLCFAAVTTSAFFAASKITYFPLRFIAFLWVYAWPVVLTVNIVAAATWRMKLVVSSIYFIILATLEIIAAMKIPRFNWGQIPIAWLLINLPAMLLLIALLNHKARAVGPLVLIVMLLAATGSNLALLLVNQNARLLSFIVKFNVALGLGDYIFIELIVVGFVIFGIVGWLALQWIVSRYKQKQISDQSLTIDAIWLLYGVAQSIDLIFEDVAWFFAGTLAFVVFAMVVWAEFSLLYRKAPASQKSPTLLLLRVFSLGKRSEQLFNILATYWRYIGGIRLIAGPDLATTTVAPHEFLDFLSGKLARRFIDNAQTLELRISEMDLKPDHDGRFRVNDFFCHDDTWRMVLSRLVNESDVVLMDLRGFSLQNAGCVFEISELINITPLRQVIFIIDDTTDEPFLRQTIQQSWDHMKPTSPNQLSTSGPLYLFRLKRLHKAELDQLFRVLCIAANVTS